MTQPINTALVHQRLEPRTDSDGLRPGLLMLHGRGSDELDLLSLASVLDPRLVVISARAPFRYGPGFVWYDLVDIGEPEPRSFEQGLRLLDEFSQQIVEPNRIDPQQLYLLGFSQGGMMAGALTLTHPERIAGTIALSTYLPLHAGLTICEANLRNQPFFVAHGTQDQVIPVSFGRETHNYLSRVKADVTYQEYPMAHQISGETLSDLASWLTTRLDGNTSTHGNH